MVGPDGRVALPLEALHAGVIDPQMDSMRLLSETAARFPDALSFSSGAPYDANYDLEKIPYYIELYLEHLRTAGIPEKHIKRMMFQYGTVNGFVQADVARMLKCDEGIDVPPESIMITNGCQEAMLVALRGLCTGPDDVLLTVSPAYVGILGAARMLDIPLHGVVESLQGLDPEAVAVAAREVRTAGRRPVAVYLVPDFANPTGTVLPLAARRRLLQVAADEGLMILEDNPYGLFGRDGEELPTLKSLDTTGQVIYLGSFAKTAFPGARMGYLVADQRVTRPDGSVRMLAEELSKVKSMFSVGTSSLSQAMIGGLLVHHDFDLRRATRELSRIYLDRLDTIVDALGEHFPPDRYPEHHVRWNAPRGGFFLMVEVGFAADLAAMERSAQEYGVSWAPMSMFYVDGGGERVLRLGFSNLAPEDIREGVARLARFITETPTDFPTSPELLPGSQMNDSTARPVAVVVDGYSAGNFFPAAFRAAGAEVVHLQSTAELIPTMLAPRFAEYGRNIEATSEQEMLRQLERLSPVCVIPGQESAVQLADRLSEALGLPSNGTRLSSARRDKYQMIEALRAAGVRCVDQFKSEDPAAVVAWAQGRGGYPVVVKPISSAASDGVYICADAAAVARAAREVLATRNIFGFPNTEVLVQSYLAGTEYIVDTVSCDGERYVCGVWRYDKSLLSSGKNIYDRDILACQHEAPVPELISYIDKVLDALDIRWGAAHAEVIMTPEGPVLVEIGARLNGNLDPGFHDVCLGHNQAELTAMAYTSPEEFRKEFGGRTYEKRQPGVVYNVPTTLDGTVGSVDDAIVRSFRELPGVYSVHVKLGPGARIRPTVDLLTSPVRIYLTDADDKRVTADYAEIRASKDAIYHLA